MQSWIKSTIIVWFIFLHNFIVQHNLGNSVSINYNCSPTALGELNDRRRQMKCPSHRGPLALGTDDRQNLYTNCFSAVSGQRPALSLPLGGLRLSNGSAVRNTQFFGRVICQKSILLKTNALIPPPKFYQNLRYAIIQHQFIGIFGKLSSYNSKVGNGCKVSDGVPKLSFGPQDHHLQLTHYPRWRDGWRLTQR